MTNPDARRFRFKRVERLARYVVDGCQTDTDRSRFAVRMQWPAVPASDLSPEGQALLNSAACALLQTDAG